MYKNYKCQFVSSPQFFNLLQTCPQSLVVINLLETNTVEDLEIDTINIYNELDKLIEFNPIDLKTGSQLSKFLTEENNDLLKKIANLIQDKRVKNKFEKRKRNYIAIITNQSTIARNLVKEFESDLNDFFTPINKLPYSKLIEKFDKVSVNIYDWANKYLG